MFKIMNKSILIFSTILLLVTTGCRHKKIAVGYTQDSFALQETIARLSDVPDTPVGFKIKKIEKDESNPDNVRIEYLAKKKDLVQSEDIKHLYCSNMELLGWNLIAMFDGPDLLLLFERPRGKKCIVSLHRDGYLMVSILGKKRDL